MSQPPLILASSSPYRRELLARLNLPFKCEKPDIDETRKPNESAIDLVSRLATQKALRFAEKYPAAIIIGSDQVATCGQDILSKPGEHTVAVKQLRELAGKNVVFYTGLCVLNSASEKLQVDCIQVNVKFRSLGTDEINRYLMAEKPYDCAGSFRSEGYGITLVDEIQCNDMTALIGLPMIRLCEMLREEKIKLP